jgi:hypothetical protein
MIRAERGTMDNEPNPQRPRFAQTPDDMSQGALFQRMKSSRPLERWDAARWLATGWKKGDPTTQANLECVPVLLEVLEQHDEHTVLQAIDAAELLTRNLELHTNDVKSAFTHCLSRANEKLASPETTLAPSGGNPALARVTLDARIQDYEFLVQTLERKLQSWSSETETAPTVGRGMTTPITPMMPKASGGMPKGLLLALPVVILVGGVLFWRMQPTSSASDDRGSSSQHAGHRGKPGKH